MSSAAAEAEEDPSLPESMKMNRPRITNKDMMRIVNEVQQKDNAWVDRGRDITSLKCYIATQNKMPKK